MVTIIKGTNNKSVVSEELIDFFTKHEKYEGFLYIGYPIIGTVNGPFSIDAMLVSEDKGLMAFNLITGTDVEGYKDVQDECANKLEAKLRGYNELLNRRHLCVKISVVTYAPSVNSITDFDEDYPLCNDMTMEKWIDSISWDESNYFKELLSVLQSISSIRKGRKRIIKKENSRGAKVQLLEEAISNLDNRQSEAVIETVEGVQRIRGLAGSGKTIVLALKSAYLHAQHPDWKIAVTFNTRSLKGQFKKLISNFYLEMTNEEPNWDNLSIIHAWGAPGADDKRGIYYDFCCSHGVKYHDYSSAKNRFGSEDPFGKACEIALSEVGSYEEYYDAIIIDEAQDFSQFFLRLCYCILNEPKRLVYAYDELQNLSMKSLPSPEEIFGLDENGLPRVRMDGQQENQDIILEKCYRNSKQVLVTAHALGFGIYREKKFDEETGLVQMFQRSSLWKDIGYSVMEGELNEGKRVVLSRTPDTSPEFLEKHSDEDDLISFLCFDNKEAQDCWVAEQIIKNLTEDELRPNDILVINPDPISAKINVSDIRAMLFKRGVMSHTAGVDTDPDVFFGENNDSITFTGIYRAKGNEAAMVYVVNSESCYDAPYEKAKIRNQLFTAITRGKAWVRVLGIGKGMKELRKEYLQVKKHGYRLDFTYPTDSQLQHINIVNRDLSRAEKIRINNNNKNMNELLQQLSTGDMRVEDIDPEIRAAIVRMLA